MNQLNNSFERVIFGRRDKTIKYPFRTLFFKCGSLMGSEEYYICKICDHTQTREKSRALSENEINNHHAMHVEECEW
tara:strand:- start:623 stop:853 length:231 start_codon:yes stop_codon:yes gene_type:complete